MGFPFVDRPFSEWVQKKLKKRETSFAKSIEQNRHTPFVWLSSGMVVNTGARPKDINDALKGAKYKGCVISNHLAVGTKYPIKDSILGYDLEGKPILIEGQNGLKISPPIIESLEIDTTGENATLKTAKLSITVFSLKQLEMFELFFLKPAALLVLEYGNNNPATKQIVSQTSFLRNKNFTTYCNEVLDFYSPVLETYSKKRGEYYENIEKTEGDYDFWICRVHDFASTYEAEDNVYKVELTVSAGNELHMWMRVKPQTKETPIKKKDNNQKGVQAQPTEGKVTTPKTALEELCSDMMLSEKTITTLKNDVKDYEKEFFNLNVTSDSSNNDVVSKDQYISMKLVLDILNAAPIYKAYEQLISYNLIEHNGKPFIPINSHKDVISTNGDFIIPGNLPKMVVDISLPTKIGISEKTRTNRPINGKTFNVDNPEVTLRFAGNEKVKLPGTFGNLLDIFVKKDLVIRLFKNHDASYASVFDELLGMLNELMFGLCKLEIGKLDESLNSTMTIIDKKLRGQNTVKAFANQSRNDRGMYRFKIGTTNSIIYDFNFNLEMSELMSAQAMYEAQLTLFETSRAKSTSQGQSFPLSDRDFLRILGATNSDNLYSVDYLNHQNNVKLKEINKDSDNKIVPAPADGKKPNTETDTDVKSLESVVKGKSIKFKAEASGKDPDSLIYLDIALIQSLITNEIPNSSVLTYLECDLTIDGMVGIQCGQLFHIDGIPEIYNINGAFQVTDMKHSIQPDTGWRTTINASFRYNVK